MLEASSQYFDVVVVYWLLDPAAAGIYFAASRLANVFAMLLSALNSFANRRLPALYFAGARAEIDRGLILMAEVSAICVAVGLMMFSFGSTELLGLFGASFVTHRWTLIVLAIGTAVQTAGGPAAAILLGDRSTRALATFRGRRATSPCACSASSVADLRASACWARPSPAP